MLVQDKSATETLEPIIPQYIGELIAWSAIGARTTESRLKPVEESKAMPISSDKLSANLALYQLTESNVLTTDPNNTNFSIATGWHKMAKAAKLGRGNLGSNAREKHQYFFISRNNLQTTG
jgi:phospho-2-dehydro-3-deoxyheptonate aldolase